MKKMLLVVTALVLLVSTGLYAGAQKETETGTEGMITLTMFAYLDRTDDVLVRNWDELLAAFYDTHPDIKLDIEYLTNEPYHDKLQTMSIADQLPDIVFLWPGKRTGEVTTSGQIKDLQPWIKGHEDEFAVMAMSPQGPDGEMWELPEQVTATHVMFANERLMKELGLTFPKTFDQLLEQGKVINEAGFIPIAMANGDGWEMQSCLMSTLTERAGGMDWYDKVITGDGAAFTDPEFIHALTVIKTLYDNDMFMPGINQADYNQGIDAFVNEEAVYYIDGGWQVRNLVGELTDEQKTYVTLNVFPDIPDQKGDSSSTAAVAGTGYGMNANLSGAKADAAWEWIWFYSGPEGSKIRHKNGAIPAYKLEPLPDLDPLIVKLINFLNTHPMGYVLDAQLDAEGMGVLNPGLQEMMMGSITPEELAEKYEDWCAANDSNRQ
jgi:raffinose/stachyose/melibiose transport system substrate-binding protein